MQSDDGADNKEGGIPQGSVSTPMRTKDFENALLRERQRGAIQGAQAAMSAIAQLTPAVYHAQQAVFGVAQAQQAAASRLLPLFDIQSSHYRRDAPQVVNQNVHLRTPVVPFTPAPSAIVPIHSNMFGLPLVNPLDAYGHGNIYNHAIATGMSGTIVSGTANPQSVQVRTSTTATSMAVLDEDKEQEADNESVECSDDEDIPWLQFNDPLMAVPMPRPKAEARLYYQQNDAGEEEATSRREVSLRVAEYNECHGKFCKQTYSRASGVHYCCIHGPDNCTYRHHWKPCIKSSNPSSVPHKVNKFVPHSCSAPPPKGKTKSINTTNYSAKQVAPVLLPWVRERLNSGKDLPSLDAKCFLAQYMFISPDAKDENWIRNALYEACRMGFGINAEQGPMMVAVKAALEDSGHKVTLYDTTVEEQKKILLENSKKEHEREQKEKKTKEKTKYVEPKNLYDPVKDVPSDAKVLYGYDYLPGYGPHMFPHMKTVFATDGAHMKTELGGTVFSLWGVDANDELVCLALSVYFDNEAERTWGNFLRAIRQHYPGFDTDDLVVIADGDKGFDTAFKSTFKRAGKFLCWKHKHENVGLRVKPAKESKQLFKNAALHTFTMDGLKIAKSKYSPKLATYLGKHPDDELYLAAVGGRTYGRTTSASAESGNSYLEFFRKMGPAVGLVAFVYKEDNRMSKHQQAAEKCEDVCPPNIVKDLNEKEKNKTDKEKANGGSPQVSIGSGEWIKVYSSKNTTMWYTVSKNNCSCGKPEVTRRPCDHQLEYAKHKQIDALDLYGAHDRTSAWKKQYKALGEIKPVAMNTVLEKTRGEHVLPVAKRMPRGRRKDKKRRRKKSEKTVAKRKKTPFDYCQGAKRK